MWVGTNVGGLNKYNPSSLIFQSFRQKNADPGGLASKVVLSFCEDREGGLWVGTMNGAGLMNRHTQEFRWFFPDHDNPRGLSNTEVWSIMTDREGGVWLGTGKGLNRYHPESGDFTRYLHQKGEPDSLSNDLIWSMTEGENGDFWLATQGGLNRFDPRTGKAKAFFSGTGGSPSLGNNKVLSICKEPSGGFLLGLHQDGVFWFDETTGKVTPYQNASHHLSDNGVNAVFVDHPGRLWVATVNGLNRLDRDMGRFESFHTDQSLPNNQVYGVLEDDRHNIWVSTNRGLARLNPSTKKIISFDSTDGLLSNEFNLGAYYRLKSGAMVFGNVNGFDLFYPSDYKANLHQPNVVITSFQKLFKEVPLAKPISKMGTIELSHEDVVVSFEFVALDFASPRKNQYAYKMEGLDDNWVNLGKQPSASFTHLKPGGYIFRVK